MADRYTKLGQSGRRGPDIEQEKQNLNEDFFEEFSFDDFAYEDIWEPPEEDEYGGEAGPGSGDTDDSSSGQVIEDETPYVELLEKDDEWATSTEIEPDDPLLGEFETALAAEIKRVTSEQENEKRKTEKNRIAAIRAARRAENESVSRAIDERNSKANVNGESIRTGGWFDADARSGWGRRRRSEVPVVHASQQRTPRTTVIGAQTPSGSQAAGIIGAGKVKPVQPGVTQNPDSIYGSDAVPAGYGQTGYGLDQSEAEKQAAIARRREAEARHWEAVARQEQDRFREAEARQREVTKALERKTLALEDTIKELQEALKSKENPGKASLDEILQEEQLRLEKEEAEKKLRRAKAGVRDDDDDDKDDGKGRTVVTVSIILLLLIVGIGVAMTYLWSHLSVKKPPTNAIPAAAVEADSVVQEAAPEEPKEDSLLEQAMKLKDESRAAQEEFARQQAEALARAEELEQEERNAMLAEAGLTGLPDISTRDLSEYLTEMPEEGKAICKTDTVMYSYDQMVKDLYFLTVRYGDFISTGIIGTTFDQRSLYQAIIGNANASKHIVVYYAIDGADYIDCVLAMNQLEAYCKARKNGTSYKNHPVDSLFDDVCIHVIPMANPDGVSICQYGVDALRTVDARVTVQAAYEADKEAGRTGEPIENYVRTFHANAGGVDLRTNFDIGWSGYTAGPNMPSAAGYKGSSPMSEPETQALVNLVNSVSAAAVVGYGTNGEKVEYGYGYDGPALTGVSGVTDIGIDGLVGALSAKTGYESEEMPVYNAEQAGSAAQYFQYVKNTPSVFVRAGSGEIPLDETNMSAVWKANSELFQMLGNLYTNGE